MIMTGDAWRVSVVSRRRPAAVEADYYDGQFSVAGMKLAQEQILRAMRPLCSSGSHRTGSASPTHILIPCQARRLQGVRAELDAIIAEHSDPSRRLGRRR